MRAQRTTRRWQAGRRVSNACCQRRLAAQMRTHTCMYCSSVVPPGSWWGKGCAAQCRDRVKTEGSPRKMAAVPSPCGRCSGQQELDGRQHEVGCSDEMTLQAAAAVRRSSQTGSRQQSCIGFTRQGTGTHPPGARRGRQTAPAPTPHPAALSAPPRPGHERCTSRSHAPGGHGGSRR